MLESIIFYAIIAMFILSALFLFNKARKIININKKKSFVFISLGVNVTTIPLSLFIGGMATDSPDSTNLNFSKDFYLYREFHCSYL